MAETINAEPKKRGVFTRSVDTSLLMARLQKLAVNETVTWKELSDTIGRDVRTVAHGFLQSARQRVLKDYGIVLEAIHKVGLKRLDDTGIVKTSDYSRHKIHREAGRALTRIACIENLAGLPNDDKVKVNAARAAFGALHSITTEASQKKIVKAVVSSGGDSLAIGKTLEAFKG